MNNEELFDSLRDVFEVVIENIRENTETEINRIDKKLDRLIEILEKLV